MKFWRFAYPYVIDCLWHYLINAPFPHSVSRRSGTVSYSMPSIGQCLRKCSLKGRLYLRFAGYFFFLKDYPTCDQLTCANGACYNTSQRCDQKVDCRDSSDEANCSKSYPLTRRWQVEAGLYRFERNQCIYTLLPKLVSTESILVV